MSQSAKLIHFNGENKKNLDILLNSARPETLTQEVIKSKMKILT